MFPVIQTLKEEAELDVPWGPGDSLACPGGGTGVCRAAPLLGTKAAVFPARGVFPGGAGGSVQEHFLILLQGELQGPD